jgi:ketosteroid isomerase-like protein
MTWDLLDMRRDARRSARRDIPRAGTRTRMLGILIAGATLLAMPSVTSAQTRQRAADSAAVNRALEHYVHLVERMQSDSIAALFSANGRLMTRGRPSAIGPAAIATFLHSFDNYHVLSEAMIPSRLQFAGDSAIQLGAYTQRVRVPSGDSIVVRGTFSIIWERGPGGTWRIRQASTEPTPASRSK